jgi:hypothetical protein
MAWKTKDVDDAYTESWWIFVLFCVQLEILLIGVPLIAILRGVSTNGKIVGYIMLYWVLPVTALSLIMVPKYIAYWRAEHNLSASTVKRGVRGHARVSGLVQQYDDTPLNTGYEPTRKSNESSVIPNSECDANVADGGHAGDSQLTVAAGSPAGQFSLNEEIDQAPLYLASDEEAMLQKFG